MSIVTERSQFFRHKLHLLRFVVDLSIQHEVQQDVQQIEGLQHSDVLYSLLYGLRL